MDKNVYRITLPNFFNHNPKSKKSFTHFMISKSFFIDDKISRCTPGMVALYVYLIGVCADFASSTINVSLNSVPSNLKVGVRFAEVLKRLEELQLLTIEKNSPLYNRIEEKRIEEKGREVNRGSPSNKKIGLENNRKVWNAYLNSYLERYKVEPIRNAKVNSIISQLVKRVGTDEAILLVQFYLSHNKHFYISKMHDLSACLVDAEALVTQRLRGRPILDKDIKDYVQQSGFNELLEASEKGGF